MINDNIIEIAHICPNPLINPIIQMQEHNGLLNGNLQNKNAIYDNDDKISDNDDKFVVKSHKTLSCEICDYNTYRKSDYNKHILSRKHKNNDISDKNDDTLSQKVVNSFICKCGKVYKYRQGLCYHKKRANYIWLKPKIKKTKKN